MVRKHTSQNTFSSNKPTNGPNQLKSQQTVLTECADLWVPEDKKKQDQTFS